MGNSPVQRLLSELKRRRVFRVAGVYAVVAFVVLQVGDLVVEPLALPPWAMTLLIVLAGLGFPIAVALAWALDFTQQGVRRTSAEPAMEPHGEGAEPPSAGTTPTPRTGRSAVLRFAIGALSILLVSTGIVGGWRSESRPTAMSPEAVAVLPFSVGGGEEAQYLGDGLVHLLATNLDGAGELRAVDSRSVLNAVGREGHAALDAAAAPRIAAQLGAGLYVMGEVVGIGEQVRINAALYDTRTPGHPVVRASVEGSLRQPFEAVDRLAVQLLATRSSTPAASLADVTTRSLPALKAYLAGEAAFQVADPRSGMDAMRRATALDSTFALAYARLALAASWLGMADVAQAAIERALGQTSRLSSRDRRVVEALDAFLGGRNDEAERIYRAIVAEYPEDAEAWYMLGETLLHFNYLHGRRPDEARQAFTQALALRPDRAGSLLHAAQLARRAGDRVAFDSLTRRMLTQPADPGWIAGVRALRAFELGDTATQREVMAELGRASDEFATFAATMAISGPNVLLDVGDLLADPRRSDGTRALGHGLRLQHHFALGQLQTARAELNEMAALDPAPAVQIEALLALSPILPDSRAALESARRRVEEWDPAATPRAAGGGTFLQARHGGEAIVRAYLLGLLEASLGEADRALRRAADLERLTEPADAPSLAHDLAGSVRAEVARRRGDLVEAKAQLDRARRRVRWDILEVTPIHDQSRERYLQGELAEALGQDDEALRWFESLTHHPSLYEAVGHLRLAEVRERREERDRAAEHYARFLALWQDCDPDLRPLVEGARSRLAALTAEHAKGSER